MNQPLPETTNTKALVSLIFGILAWCLLPVVGAIVAILFGHFARGELRRQPPPAQSGEAFALTGLILGWVQLALLVIGFLVVFVFFGGIAAIALLAN